MRIDVLTLFPEACEPFFAASVLGKANQAGLVTIRCHNIRQWTLDPHGKVDDRPFGGGPGMVMMCQPVFDAVDAVEKMDAQVATRILLTPQGRPLNQALAGELARKDRLLMVAGHYEGFDERIRLGLSATEISIGDYVLSGGEAAAMVLVDAVVRLIPGVLGHEDSTAEESFSLTGPQNGPDGDNGRDVYLEYPQYTRPRTFRGMDVPEVLVSGDHAKVRTWRSEQARRRTRERRPDLMSGPERNG
jgi:tRNA (guanine37-N1)-methyltransferase